MPSLCTFSYFRAGSFPLCPLNPVKHARKEEKESNAKINSFRLIFCFVVSAILFLRIAHGFSFLRPFWDLAQEHDWEGNTQGAKNIIWDSHFWVFVLSCTPFMPETSSGSPFFFSCSVFLHFPLKFLDLICEIFHQESSGLCARGREGGGRREKNGNLLTQICMVDRNRKRQTKMKSFSGSLTVSEWVRDKLKKKEERTPGRLSTVCDPLHSQILAPFFFSPVNLAKQCQLFLLDQRQFLKASSIAVGLCSKLKLLNAFMVASQVFLAEFRSLSDCGVCICPGLFMSCEFEVFSRHLFNAQWHLLHVEVRPIKRPVYVIKVDWKVHTRWMETEREGERKVSALLRRSSQQSLRGEIWFDSRIFIFLPVSFLAEKKDMKHFHAAIFKRTNRNIRDANSNTNRS